MPSNALAEALSKFGYDYEKCVAALVECDGDAEKAAVFLVQTYGEPTVMLSPAEKGKGTPGGTSQGAGGIGEHGSSSLVVPLSLAKPAPCTSASNQCGAPLMHCTSAVLTMSQISQRVHLLMEMVWCT